MPGKTHLHQMPGCDSLGHNSSVHSVTRSSGNPEASTNIPTEWVCPDCDYFEDVEEESE